MRRDPAAAGLEVTALVRRAEGVGGRRFSDAEFDACVRGAKLAADKDDKGNVVARLVFPDAPTTDKDEARRYTERRDSSCEVEFVVRTDGLAGVVANNVTGNLRVEGDVGKASLTTISGDVFVRGTTGAVTAKSVSGDIDLRAVAAAVAASSISGNIRVDLADAAKDPIDVESTSGSIELTLSAAWQGTWRASSTMGAVTVDGRSARTGRRAQDGMGTDAKGTIGDADAARAKLDQALALSVLMRNDIGLMLADVAKTEAKAKYRAARDLEVLGRKLEALQAFVALVESCPAGVDDEKARVAGLQADVDGWARHWAAADAAEAAGDLDKALEEGLEAQRYYAHPEGKLRLERLREAIAARKQPPDGGEREQ